MNLERWLAERTFHHSNFWDRKWLSEEKQRQGLRISLCLPAYNKEKTIGKEIVIYKSELHDRYPVVDEIAVIDSGSTDRTREIAAEFGVNVYLASEHLPQYGDHRGKGENLWKALYLLTGDIIVFVDADITNTHPRFVYGLLGPLIKDPEVHYVKAFYDRPLAFSQGLRPTGGGRVTEILIRPLFSLFYPDLTGIIQPLSGEYAGRRSILERIPFPVGYGVETAMLIDIYNRLGLGGFAQTDLDVRVHRNQETTALGRMAFGVLRTFLARLTRDQKARIEYDLPFEENLAAADLILSTSVAEGFGMVFLEPWLADRSLVGRDIPEITADFTAAGVELKHLYPRLRIPLSLVGRGPFLETVASGYSALLEAYHRPPPCRERLLDCLAGRIDGGTVDFADLDASRQERVIRRLHGIPALRQTVLKLNPALRRALGTESPTPPATILGNRRAVELRYSLSAIGSHLLAVYRSVVASPRARSFARPARGEAILEHFLAPRHFRPILTTEYAHAHG